MKFGVEDVDLSVDVRVAMGEDGTGSRGRRGGRDRVCAPGHRAKMRDLERHQDAGG